MGELIDVSAVEDGVAVLTLTRPEKRNALSVALRNEVTAALADLAGRSDLKVLVVTGAGDTFCSGFDLDEFADADPAFQHMLWYSSDRFHHAVLRFPVPVVAAVNGPALAGGFDLAVLCDLRVASTTARFAHPEQAVGDVVYGPLRDLVGGAVARELCLTGRSVDAEEALALRLVSSVVSPDRVLPAARDLAASVARAPRDALVRTRAKIVERLGIPEATTTLDL